MEVAQTDILRLIDQDGIGVRDVQAVLDDGRAEEQVVVPPHEIQHAVFQFLRFHLAVGDADAHIRNQPVKNVLDGGKLLYLIM